MNVPYNINTAEPRHADIADDQIRPAGVDHRLQLDPVPRFSYNIQTKRIPGNQLLQSAQDDRFIICQQHPDASVHRYPSPSLSFYLFKRRLPPVSLSYQT
ncbi:hypothetical protein D3C81_1777010 [compost metagenome]